MIIRFDLYEDIHSPLEDVFSFLSNFSNMPKWNYYIISVTQISPGQIQTGTVFEQIRLRDKHSYKIIQYIPCNKVLIEILPPGPMLQLGFELFAKEEITQVVYSWQIDLRKYKLFKYIPNGWIKNGLLSIVQAVVLKKIKPAVAQNFAKLKILIETGSVTLQDGRLITLT